MERVRVEADAGALGDDEVHRVAGRQRRHAGGDERGERERHEELRVAPRIDGAEQRERDGRDEQDRGIVREQRGGDRREREHEAKREPHRPPRARLDQAREPREHAELGGTRGRGHQPEDRDERTPQPVRGLGDIGGFTTPPASPIATPAAAPAAGAHALRHPSAITSAHAIATAGTTIRHGTTRSKSPAARLLAHHEDVRALCSGCELSSPVCKLRGIGAAREGAGHGGADRRRPQTDKALAALHPAKLEKASQLDTLDGKIADYFARTQTRRGYLMTDKPLYQPGETIWLRADVRMTGTLKAPPTGASLSLVSPRGAVVAQKRVMAKDGVAANDFQLVARPRRRRVHDPARER